MKTLILYHGSACPDGFGAAYAAWKKFGDMVEYVPLSRGDEPPYELIQGAEVYFLDFSYEKDVMLRIREIAGRLVVLDHHKGVQEAIESAPEYVFDVERSGAGIAWDYFHKDVPRPKLLDHVEDDDLFRFSLPDTRALITYLETVPFDFTVWDDVAKTLDDESKRDTLLVRARTYREYFERLAELSIERAKLVLFEGMEIYFAASHPLKSLKSYIGNELVKRHGPCALVVTPHPEGFGVSIRGDNSVDVAKLAQKHGGNGHPRSAGFLVPADKPLPWTYIHDEDTRN